MSSKFMTALTALSAIAGGGMAGAAGSEAAFTEEPYFVALKEVTTPIFGASRIEGAMNVTLVVEALDTPAAAQVNTKMPELRAATLATVIEFSRLYASGFTPVNAEQLSADLNAALKRVDPSVSRVLIVKLSAVPA